MKLKPHSLALRVSLIYCLTAGAWILLSDRILAWFVPDPAQLSHLQTYKGWAFVVITGLLLYWVLAQWSWEWEVAQARKKMTATLSNNLAGDRALEEFKPADAAPDAVERQLRRTVNAGTLMALLIMGFIGYTAWQEARQATAHAQWALHSHQVLRTVTDTLGSVLDVEASVRISASPDLLEAHNRALAGIDSKLKELRHLTADHPDRQRQLDGLELQIAASLAFVKHVMTVRAAEGSAAAVQLVESGQGKLLMDEVRTSIKTIRDAEEQLLQTHEAAFIASDRQSDAITLLGALAGGILMSLAWVTLGREVRAEGRARAEVRRLNVELEQRVIQRTAQLTQVNESLRTSEERYRSTLDNILEGCQLIGFDWRYLYLNDAAASQNRRPNSELLGRKMTEVWPDIEATGIFGLLRRCMEERTALHEETEFEFPDGSKGWFDVRSQPVPEGIFVLSIDISERRHAEVAIRREQDFSNAVLNSLPGVVYCYNERLQFRRWNKNLERVTGCTGDEILRLSPLDFFAGAERELIQSRIQEVFTKGASEVEANIVAKDGRSLPFFLNGMTAEINGERCLVGVGIEITERKRAEAALRQSENRLRSIIETEPECVKVVSHDGRLLEMNHAGLAMLEADSLAAVQQVPLMEFIVPEYRAAFRGLHKLVMEGGSGRLEFEIIGLRGGRRWLETHAAPLRDASNQPEALLGITRDVTERKQTEQKLIESREQLRALIAQLQRAQEEERIRVAREIHDELGQLLTGLKMDVRWLERKLAAPDLPPALLPLLDRAVAASELADTTIATVQKIAAELRPGALDQLGLAAALTQKARRFQERSGVHCTVVVSEFDAQLPPDVATELFYICQEALTNVVRHAHAQNVEIRLRTEGEVTVFELRDDGTGITDADLNAARSLGLLGMKERVRHCQGTIVFERGGQGGTQITVRIPRVGGSTQAGGDAG